MKTDRGRRRGPSAIDAHAHCSDRTDDALVPYAKRNGLEYSLNELLSEMEEHNVERGLLLSPPLADGSPLPNHDVIELCDRSGGKLLPIITVEPGRASVAAALRLARRTDAVKGFKIRLGYVEVFADDPVFQPLYEYAVERRLPILFHTGDTATSTGSLRHAHPLTLDPLANRMEDLRVVICHMGNPWMLETAEMVYKHANVYADISGLIAGGSRYQDQYMDDLAARISEVVYFAGGADKLLFGTDYPVQSHANSFELVGRLRIEPDDVRKVLAQNAVKVFSL